MNQDWADKFIKRHDLRGKVPENIRELCDKLEVLLEDEEEHLESVGEQFHPVTWETWSILREILTGHDCIPAEGGESK